MAYIYDLTDTWNAGGTTFNAIKMNVTDSASAAGSKLVTLQTNGTEHFSVTKAGVGYFSGNVGIGTSSPGGYKLAVTSASNLLALSDGSTQNLLVTVTSGAGSAGAFNFNANNGGSFVWQISGAERARIDSSGNVGIGTSSPGHKLAVTSASNLLALSDGSTQNMFVTVTSGAGSAGAFNFNANNGGSFVWQISGTERARIDSSGNLLVGKTTAGGAAPGLELANNGTHGGKIDFYRIDNVNTQYHAEFRLTNGTTVGTISTTTTATSYNTSSDYRLKDIDGPITNSGAYIDALKPVQGSWKSDGSRFIGLLAHEVQEVSETPIATGVKDGEEMQAMDYSAPEIIANLIAEIQSLRARVAQLEGN